jgi:hypothetical protein
LDELEDFGDPGSAIELMLSLFTRKTGEEEGERMEEGCLRGIVSDDLRTGSFSRKANGNDLQVRVGQNKVKGERVKGKELTQHFKKIRKAK